MNQDAIEGYVSKISCELRLSQYQTELLKRIITARSNGDTVYIIPCRMNGRTMLRKACEKIFQELGIE